MKQKFKIFYVSPEVFPFAHSSDVAEVAGSFPKTLKNLGHDIRVMMPNYRSVNERRYVLRDVIRLQGLKINVGDEEFEASGKSAFIPESKVQIYFLDNKELFNYDGGVGHDDDAKRFMFFAVGCLETLKLLYWQPDIIHCNEWQAALIPWLLATVYKDDDFFKNCKTLLSIHNPGNQGIFDAAVAKSAGVGFAGAAERVSFLEAGIRYADSINFTNDHVVEQIRDEADPWQLREALEKRDRDYVVINNGIDEQVWDPEKDKSISASYSQKEPDAKKDNKKTLLEHFGLSGESDAAIVGTHSAFANTENTDWFLDAIKALAGRDIHFLAIGPGKDVFMQEVRTLQEKYPDKIALDAKPDPKLSHLLGAGSDFFLIPSYSTVAGLAPMHSLAYGTIPIVPNSPAFRGLVSNWDSGYAGGNGVLFDEGTSDSLVGGIDRALQAYADNASWQKIVKAAMSSDFSWNVPTQEYLKLYQKLASGKARPH